MVMGRRWREYDYADLMSLSDRMKQGEDEYNSGLPPRERAATVKQLLAAGLLDLDDALDMNESGLMEECSECTRGEASDMIDKLKGKGRGA